MTNGLIIQKLGDVICPANEWTGFYDKEFCHEREKGDFYVRHQTVWLGNVDKD